MPAAHTVRRAGAALYYGGLRTLGVAALYRRFRDAGLILCYHNVVSAADTLGDPGLHLPVHRFERQMRWLAAHYDVISLREFVDRQRSGASLRAVAAVTFDDGYAGVFEHALPVLDRLHLPATVFLVSHAVDSQAGFWWDHPAVVQSATMAHREQWLIDFRGDGDAILASHPPHATVSLPASHRPADWPTIRAALRGHIEIGIHSATHRSLPTLSDDELEDEVVASRAVVQQATGILSDWFAYPYGRWNSRVRAAVVAAGYRGAVTLDDGLNGTQADAWTLGRVNVPTAIPDAAFQAWAAGFRGLRSAR